MGKGTYWRRGTNFKKYNDADYWKELEKRKANKQVEVKTESKKTINKE